VFVFVFAFGFAFAFAFAFSPFFALAFALFGRLHSGWRRHPGGFHEDRGVADAATDSTAPT